MKVAALDLGSNTFLLLIAEVEHQRITKVYRDETQVVRLGHNLAKTGSIAPDALVRAEACFRRYREIMDEHRPDVVVAVATSAARDAKNRAEFEALAQKYQIPVRTISGDQEAAITFRGATFDCPSTEGVGVVDVGGGSTEIIGLSAENKLEGLSVDVGSVRLTDQFFPSQPPSFEHVQKLQQYVTAQFQAVKSRLPKNVKTLVAVAGTPTALACLELGKSYDENFVHQSKLQLDMLQSWILKLFPLPVSEREKLPGMPPQRSDVLVAGTCILAAALGALRVRELTVSTKGVRFGLALEWEKFR